MNAEAVFRELQGMGSENYKRLLMKNYGVKEPFFRGENRGDEEDPEADREGLSIGAGSLRDGELRRDVPGGVDRR